MGRIRMGRRRKMGEGGGEEGGLGGGENKQNGAEERVK